LVFALSFEQKEIFASNRYHRRRIGTIITSKSCCFKHRRLAIPLLTQKWRYLSENAAKTGVMEGEVL
jgi:hypothetical protein